MAQLSDFTQKFVNMGFSIQDTLKAYQSVGTNQQKVIDYLLNKDSAPDVHLSQNHKSNNVTEVISDNFNDIYRFTDDETANAEESKDEQKQSVLIDTNCINTKTKSHPICSCGAPLQKFQVRYTGYDYPARGVACNSCEISIDDPQELIYHCVKKRTMQHANGYDLCLVCAQKQLNDVDTDQKYVETEEKHIEKTEQFSGNAPDESIVSLSHKEIKGVEAILRDHAYHVQDTSEKDDEDANCYADDEEDEDDEALQKAITMSKTEDKLHDDDEKAQYINYHKQKPDSSVIDNKQKVYNNYQDAAKDSDWIYEFTDDENQPPIKEHDSNDDEELQKAITMSKMKKMLTEPKHMESEDEKDDEKGSNDPQIQKVYEWQWASHKQSVWHSYNPEINQALNSLVIGETICVVIHSNWYELKRVTETIATQTSIVGDRIRNVRAITQKESNKDDDESCIQNLDHTIIDKTISSTTQLRQAVESWTEQHQCEESLLENHTYTVTSCHGGECNEDAHSSSSEQSTSDESGDNKEEHRDHNTPNNNNNDDQQNGNSKYNNFNWNDICYDCDKPLHKIRMKQMQAEIHRLRLLLKLHDIDANIAHLPQHIKEEKSREDSCKILLIRQLTKKTIPQKAHESFTNVVKHMQQYRDIYDKAIKTFPSQKGSIQVIDYKIHCKKTQEPLYVICKALPPKKDRDDTHIAWKTTPKLYTAANLIDDFKIPTDDLPNAVLKSSLDSDINHELELIKSILMDVKQRNAFVSRKKVPWNCGDKIAIYNKSTRYGLNLILTKKEFEKRLRDFSDKSKNIDLVPIVRRNNNGYKAEIAWIVSIGFDQNIAITLALNKSKILMAQGIYLDIYDSHKLAHNALNCKCLSKFEWKLDRLEIGENKSKICKQFNEYNRLRKKDDDVIEHVLYYCDLLQSDLKNTQIYVNSLLKKQNECQTTQAMLALNAMQLQQLNTRIQSDNHQLVTQINNISNNYN